MIFLTLNRNGIHPGFRTEFILQIDVGSGKTQQAAAAIATGGDPTPDLVLATGDELFLEGSDEDAWRFAEDETVQFGLAGPDEIEKLLGRGLVLAELALSPRSSLAGSSSPTRPIRT